MIFEVKTISVIEYICLYFRWLDYLLSRIVYQAKAFVMNAKRDRDKVAKKMERINNRLSAIESEQGKVVEDLRKHLKAKIDEAVQKLSIFLKSDEVKTRFISWNLDEVPEIEVSWQVTENNINKALQTRLKEIIEHWEEDERLFADARDSLLHNFQEQYDFVEGQIRNLQDSVTTDDPISVSEADPSENFSMAVKFAIGFTSPVWVPLTLIALVIGSPIVGIISIKNKIEDSRRLRRYEKDRCSLMAERSVDYLNNATNESILKVFVKSQLSEAKLCLKHIEARIPELIHADKMLYNQLRHETRSHKEIQESYQPVLNRALEIRGQLALFGLREIRTADISSLELEWKADRSLLLGQGEFATVMEGKMKRHGEEQSVALKIWNESLDINNASHVLAEASLLRYEFLSLLSILLRGCILF